MPRLGKSKQPREVIQSMTESLTVLSSLNKNEKDRKKAADEIARYLRALREQLTDKSDTRFTGKEKDADFSMTERVRISEIITEVSHEMINQHTIPLLINNLEFIEFESSKQVVELCGHIMRRQVGHYNPAAQYFLSHKEILLTLLRGYEKPESAIHYGAILRDACRHEALVKVVLGTPEFYKLFNHAQGTAFDVSSDAFATLRDLLTRHKTVVAEFLQQNYDEFFNQYLCMLNSENYVTERQALKLLGELLLDRNNFTVMTRYIAEPENLKIIMNLLKRREKHIAFEAFHCFKVFVANPNKPPAVHMILYQNQEKLLNFLTNFQTERTDDGQFKDEKQYIIKQIRDLKPPAPPRPSASVQPTAPQTAAK